MASTRAPPEESNLLDEEIASLKDQVAALRRSLLVETSTVLSSKSTERIVRSSASQSSRLSRNAQSAGASRKLADRSAQQQAYNQQCLYRISNSVTAFKVRDPDPNAVDGGHVLGLRFEVMSRAQFLRPYYVMLNRPYDNSKHLRVHRHTLPPAVPLAGLAARHLPPPKAENQGTSEQDLERFARALRREITRYHNRLGVSADLRRSLGLHDDVREPRSVNDLVEVGIADIEAKQIRLAWADERNGRVVMDDDGNVVKLMVFGKQGRDWETTKELHGNYERIDDVAKKLEEYTAG